MVLELLTSARPGGTSLGPHLPRHLLRTPRACTPQEVQAMGMCPGVSAAFLTFPVPIPLAYLSPSTASPECWAGGRHDEGRGQPCANAKVPGKQDTGPNPSQVLKQKKREGRRSPHEKARLGLCPLAWGRTVGTAPGARGLQDHGRLSPQGGWLSRLSVLPGSESLTLAQHWPERLSESSGGKAGATS